ncbi:MAG: hypothetical protein G8237_04070 [Magnetococcales bacterium]|nr:hypothetical protein [Magnetococcales bacterium]NGZ05510.1 hypothetical protein [Magnetococcales bacterium]
MTRLTAYDSYAMPLNPNNVVINLASVDPDSFDTDYYSYINFSARDLNGNLIGFLVRGDYEQEYISDIQISKNGNPYLVVDEISPSLVQYAMTVSDPTQVNAATLARFYAESDRFVGSNGADVFQGYGGDDSFSGGGGNDRLDGGSGQNVIDGGGGEDTLVLAGASTQYRFAQNGNTVLVTYTGYDRSESHTLTSMERVEFQGGGGARSLQELLAGAALPTVTLSGPSSVMEGNAGSSAHAYTVRLSAAASSAVTVEYLVSGDTASAGSDFVATNGTLTIPAGVTSGTFEVLVHGDGTEESDERFSVTLRSPNGALLGSGVAVTTTIRNDDALTPTLSLAGARTVSEVQGVLNCTVRLSAASSSAVTVQYATSSGSAVAGEDFAATSGTLTIRAGETSGTFAVPILDDGRSELSERFSVVLSNPGGGALLGDGSSLSITITDNDALLESSSSRVLTGNTANLLLTGFGSINGTGNSLNNTITGNGAANILRGEGGADILMGGGGGDELYGGAGDDTLNGGSGADLLRGGGGNDRLMGGSGVDRLSGEAGADQFHWSRPTEGRDVITDFNVAQGDRLYFVSPNFGFLPTGVLASSRFVANSTGRATTSRQNFLFNTASGVLKYDPDGTGPAVAMTMATVNAGSGMTASAIVMVAS